MVRTTGLTQALIGKITVQTGERAAMGGLRYGFRMQIAVRPGCGLSVMRLRMERGIGE